MTQEVGAPLVRVVAPGHRAFETLADVLDGERTVVDAVLTPEAVVLEGNRLHTSGTPLFEVDRHTLADEEALDGLAAWLLAHPEVLLLRVEGHADPLGPSAYNYALSVRRAEGVAAGLVSRGVDAGRLQVVGAGEALAGEGPVRAVGFTVIVWAERPVRGRWCSCSSASPTGRGRSPRRGSCTTSSPGLPSTSGRSSRRRRTGRSPRASRCPRSPRACRCRRSVGRVSARSTSRSSRPSRWSGRRPGSCGRRSPSTPPRGPAPRTAACRGSGWGRWCRCP
ncbi:MAG: OmpA family protein [Myxococcales bacterium]|nr:OmpA family protein [Myxococcales bacterium]